MASRPVTVQQRPEDRDRIEILEAQVQICTEDFESERRDRARAQQRIDELMQDMTILQRQVSFHGP